MISKDFQDTAGMCSCSSKRLKLMKSRLMSCLYLGFGINEHLLGVLQLTVQHIQLAKNISKFVEITSFYKSNVGKKNTFTVTDCGLIYLYRELLLSQLAHNLAFNIRRAIRDRATAPGPGRLQSEVKATDNTRLIDD